MKTYKFTKKTIAASLSVCTLCTILIYPKNSQAQTVVIDPAAIAQFASHVTLQTAWEVAREAYSRVIAAASTSAITASTDAVRATLGIQIKQAEFNQKDTDQRFRKALGEQAIAQRDIQSVPTIERCIELTGALGRASISAETHRSGGRIASALKDRLNQTVSAGIAVAAGIDGREELGTCSAFDAANKVTGCNTLGKYPDGDKSSDSLFINRDTSNSKGTSTVDGKVIKVPGANYTLDKKGQDVAMRYISNLVSSNAPIMLKPEQAKNAPVYMALYNQVMSKIDASTSTLIDVARWKFMPNATNSTTYNGFLTYWKASRSTYESMFGDTFTWPENPSEYELLRYEIIKSYADVLGSKAESSVGDDTNKKILEQAILNNYLSWIKINQTEHSNILLSLMNLNQVVPISQERLNSELIKAQGAPNSSGSR